MEKEFQIVMRRIGVDRFGVLIEHGCAFGTHFTTMLKKYADKIIGVDIYDPQKQKIENVDEYIKVPFDLKQHYFPDMADESVDAVVILSSVGLDSRMSTKIQKKDWTDYFSDIKSRQGRYLTKDNYFRILRKGGFLIIIEWEGNLHHRFGKNSLRKISANFDEYYKTPKISGFDKVYSNLTQNLFGPVLVLKKN